VSRNTSLVPSPRGSEGILVWIDALSGQDWAACHDARGRLVRLGDAAVGPVSTLLADPLEQVRWEAAKVLSEISSPRAAPALVLTLTDESSFGVRWVAAEGLIRLGRDGLWPLLESLIKLGRIQHGLAA
jgi:HEAT repeat protein